MTPQQIVNAALYADRTVQDWHRTRFPYEHAAIDLDLMGYCRKCGHAVYLIESTTNPNKPTTVLRALAKDLVIVPAFVVQHSHGVIVGGRMIYPVVRVYRDETSIAGALVSARDSHVCDIEHLPQAR